MFNQGSQVKTGQGTVGTIVSEIRHPVTQSTTAVVVQPVGTTDPEDRVVANPAPCASGNFVLDWNQTARQPASSPAEGASHGPHSDERRDRRHRGRD